MSVTIPQFAPRSMQLEGQLPPPLKVLDVLKKPVLLLPPCPPTPPAPCVPAVFPFPAAHATNPPDKTMMTATRTRSFNLCSPFMYILRESEQRQEWGKTAPADDVCVTTNACAETWQMYVV
jgi:hypothetical protein